jgi:hypothetical protein
MKGGAISLGESTYSLLHTIGIVIAYVVVVMCIARGVPVLWDGKDYVLTKRYPREIKDDK